MSKRNNNKRPAQDNIERSKSPDDADEENPFVRSLRTRDAAGRAVQGASAPLVTQQEEFRAANQGTGTRRSTQSIQAAPTVDIFSSIPAITRDTSIQVTQQIQQQGPAVLRADDSWGSSVHLGRRTWTPEQLANEIQTLSDLERRRLLQDLSDAINSTEQSLQFFFLRTEDLLRQNHNFWTAFQAAVNKNAKDSSSMAAAYNTISKIVKKGRTAKLRYEKALPWLAALFGEQWFNVYFRPYISSTMIDAFNHNRNDILDMIDDHGAQQAAEIITQQIMSAWARRLDNYASDKKQTRPNIDPGMQVKDVRNGLPGSSDKENTERAQERFANNGLGDHTLIGKYYSKLKINKKDKPQGLLRDINDYFQFPKILEAFQNKPSNKNKKPTPQPSDNVRDLMLQAGSRARVTGLSGKGKGGQTKTKTKITSASAQQDDDGDVQMDSGSQPGSGLARASTPVNQIRPTVPKTPATVRRAWTAAPLDKPDTAMQKRIDEITDQFSKKRISGQLANIPASTPPANVPASSHQNGIAVISPSASILMGKDTTPLEKIIIDFAWRVAKTFQKGQTLHAPDLVKHIESISGQYSLGDIQSALMRIAQMSVGIRDMNTSRNLNPAERELINTCLAIFYAFGLWETPISTLTTAPWRAQVRMTIARLQSWMAAYDLPQTAMQVFGTDAAGYDYGVRGNDFQEDVWNIQGVQNGWLYNDTLTRITRTMIQDQDNSNRNFQQVIDGYDMQVMINNPDDPEQRIQIGPNTNELFIIHHVHGNHYILHVVGLNNSSILEFDSMNRGTQTPSSQDAVNATLAFVGMIRENLTLGNVTVMQTETQTNTSDCGFWVIRNAANWARRRRAAPPETTGSLRVTILNEVESRFRRRAQDFIEDNNLIAQAYRSPGISAANTPVPTRPNTPIQRPSTPTPTGRSQRSASNVSSAGQQSKRNSLLGKTLTKSLSSGSVKMADEPLPFIGPWPGHAGWVSHFVIHGDAATFENGQPVLHRSTGIFYGLHYYQGIGWRPDQDVVWNDDAAAGWYRKRGKRVPDMDD